MQIAVGQVFRLHCQTCAKPKDKYFVVACLDPFLCFVINSNPTPLQASKPELMATLAPLLAADHPFLHHDSVLGCNQTFREYTQQEIVAAVAADPSVFMGVIHPNARPGVIAAVNGSVVLPTLRQMQILPHW